MEQERTPPATTRARRSSSPPRAQDQAADDAEDRLSALDDGALHAILARLPLRDAAATTVLSRRWPRVFATLPRLLLQPATFNRRGFPDEGDEDYCEDAHRWMDALDRVLNGRAAPVAAFEVCAKFMGLYDDWFDDLFRRICGSGGLLELTVTNTKYGSATRCPPPCTAARRSPRWTSTTVGSGCRKGSPACAPCGRSAPRRGRHGRRPPPPDLAVRRLGASGDPRRPQGAERHCARPMPREAGGLLVPPALHLGEEGAAAGNVYSISSAGVHRQTGEQVSGTSCSYDPAPGEDK